MVKVGQLRVIVSTTLIDGSLGHPNTTGSQLLRQLCQLRLFSMEIDESACGSQRS